MPRFHALRYQWYLLIYLSPSQYIGIILQLNILIYMVHVTGWRITLVNETHEYVYKYWLS